MGKYLGNNWWLVEEGVLFNTANQKLYKGKIPAYLLHEKTRGDRQVCMTASEFPDKIGTKFVVIDYVEDFFYSKSGKTEYVKFLNLSYINKGWGEVYGQMQKFSNDFIKGGAYALDLQVDNNYPFNLRIIQYKRL
jgi:hypothetical protein